MINGKKFLVSGSNLSLLLNKLKLNKIDFYNLHYVSEKQVSLIIPQKKVATFTLLVKNTWQCVELEKTGLGYLLTNLIKNLGIVVGAIFFIISTFVFNNFILKIEINAEDNLDVAVKEVLQDNNIDLYTNFSKVNLAELKEQIYASNSLISYVSTIKRGNTLVINVKRANSFSTQINTSQSSLISTCDGVIAELKVLRGTPLKRVGEVIKTGETIVVGDKVEQEVTFTDYVIASAKIECEYVYKSQEPQHIALAKAKLFCGQEEYVFQEVNVLDNVVTIKLKYYVIIGEII